MKKCPFQGFFCFLEFVQAHDVDDICVESEAHLNARHRQLVEILLNVLAEADALVRDGFPPTSARQFYAVDVDCRLSVMHTPKYSDICNRTSDTLHLGG